MSFVLTTALTCILSPRRGFYLSNFQLIRMTVRPILPLVFPETRGTFLPLLGGEGRGEVGRETNYLVVARCWVAGCKDPAAAAKGSLGWTNRAKGV